LSAAVVIFLIGNWIRIRAEERLLRETFGGAFEEYSRKVPAFFPGVFWRQLAAAVAEFVDSQFLDAEFECGGRQA
jgi:hypothetical protein